MSTEANKAVVRRYYDEALNSRNVAVLDELATTDYREHDPFPGQGDGLEGLKQRAQMLLGAFDPLWFEIEDIIAEGDRVVVRWTNTGSHTGAFMGIPPTGKQATIAGIDIHAVRDGKLAEHWHVVDQLSMLQQLGLIPQPEGSPA